MWHITFETRLPVGLGARSLQWDNPRLPTSADFLNLVSLHSDSYWLTLKVDGEESAPLDFVPLIILLDKHQDVLSTCTVKVGHRNPFSTASEMLENEQKTAAFIANLKGKADVAKKAVGTSPSEAQAGVDELSKAKDLKNKEVAKMDEVEVTASGSGIKPDTATPASPKPSTPTPVTYGKYTFGGRSALSSSSAPTSAHKMSALANQKLFSDSGSESGSDEDANTADSWVDARATLGSQGKAGLQSASDSDSDNDDSADANAERDDVDVNELVARVKSMMSSSGDMDSGHRGTIPLADKGKQMQDLITCRLPLLPRPDAAAAGASSLEAEDSGADINADGGKGKIQDKGKGKATAKAKSRPSYGLSLEDRCISTDNTRESTPVLADSIASMPASAATLSPSTRSRIASTYFADLCAQSDNTAATNGVLDIMQTEGVDLDSALGLKLLQLAKDLQEGGKYCPVAASPYRPIAQRAYQGASSAAKARSAYPNNNHNNNNNSSISSNGNNEKGHSHSWSSMMHHHEQSARMLEKVLNKLNDHSEMLNAIAEASGVNLLDSDSEADPDADAEGEEVEADGDDAADEVEPAAKTPTVPQSGNDVRTPKPVTATRQPVDGSPQAALQGLLTAAQTLPGASGVEPVLAPIDTALGEITHAAQPPVPGPFMAICPPHPSAMVRPEDLMRPLPDTSPTSASASAPAAAATTTTMAAPSLAAPGVDKPADVNAAIWEKVQQFAQSSAAARAKAENEQQEALQAHILDMYRLSMTIDGASATTAASKQAVLNPAHAASVTAQGVASPTTPSSGSTSTTEIRRSPLEARGLPSDLPDDHPATQRDFDYEHYQHWAAHHSRAIVAAYPVAVDQRNLHYQLLQQQQQRQQHAGVYGHPFASQANGAAAQQAAAQQAVAAAHRSLCMGPAQAQANAQGQRHGQSHAQARPPVFQHAGPNPIRGSSRSNPVVDRLCPPGSVAAATFTERMKQVAVEQGGMPGMKPM